MLLFRVEPARNGYAQQQRLDLFSTVRDRLAALPDVRSASVATHAMVGTGGSNSAVFKPGDPTFEPGSAAARAFLASRQTSVLMVSEDFFTTMGIPLLRGRPFGSADRSGAPNVAVVNREFARRFFGHENVIGRTFWTMRIPKPPVYEIVGVVADTRFTSFRREVGPLAFFAYRQRSPETATFLLKTAGDPLDLTPAVRDVVTQLDPNLPISGVRTQESLIEQSFSRERLVARFATILGAVTLLLTGLGLFGVLAYNVTRRTHEIGLRMALGADAFAVRWMVMRHSMILTAIGLIIGALAARWGTRVLDAALFGLSPTDAVSLAGVAVTMIVAALVAAVTFQRVVPPQSTRSSR